MKRIIVLAAVLLLAPAAFPKTKSPKPAKPPKNEHISNSSPEKADFRRTHPCPSNGKTTGSCPGYVVAYVKSPKQGGMHSSTNMEWVTSMEAKGRARPH